MLELASRPTPVNILIVDDQPDNLRTLAALLGREGYKVRKALNGQTALETIQALAPDLILLDIMMPAMNGYEVCTALKADPATRDIPIIFLSALSELANKAQAFEVGGQDYITKPFQTAEVLLRITNQLTMQQQRYQLQAQNQRLHQEVTARQSAQAVIQRQAEQERLLSDIIQQIRRSLQLDEILETAVQEIRQFLQVDQVGVVRIQPDGTSRMIAESVMAQTPAQLGRTFDQATTQLIWQAALTQPASPAVARIAHGQLPGDSALVYATPPTHANLIGPILHQQVPWGLIIAHQDQQPHPWLDWEMTFLQRCTDQLAIAIQHSELYHHLETQVQQRTADLQQALEFETLLKQITDQVRDSLDEDQILQKAVDALSQGIRVNCCQAYLYSPDQSKVTLVFTNAHCPTPVLAPTRAIADQPRHQQLLQKQPCQFSCLTPAAAGSLDRQTVLAYPIFDDQHVLGSLWLFKPKGEAYSDLELRLVHQVTNQCAIALRQSTLHQAAQAQVEELQKLHQLKDDFLSSISHELRTPIASMKMVIYLLANAVEKQTQALVATTEPPPPNPKINQYLQILEEECEQELQLLQDLLALQQLEAGSEPLHSAPLDLACWLPHVVEPFTSRCAQHQQSLQVDVAPHLPALHTDAFCLQRILTELLNNACKYTPAGSEITLTAIAIADVICIQVTNSGVEIPAEAIAQVFDKFYRVPNRDPWKYGGTGLGLALVHKLVAHLRGSIQVTSADQITTFTVHLKAVPPD